MAGPQSGLFADSLKQLQIAIIEDDLSGVRYILWLVQKILGLRYLEHLLTDNHQLRPLDRQHHNRIILRALRILLLDHLPDLQPQDFHNSSSMLTVHLQAYRGTPMHVAVALRRTDIVVLLLNTADRYRMRWSDQLAGADACGNSPLSVAVRSCDKGTVKVLLGALGRCPVYVAESVLRHSVAINVRRFVYCRDSDLNIVVDMVFDRLWTLRRGMVDHLLLLWYIYVADDDGVESILQTDNMYNCALHEPNPFHFAVSVCCTKALTHDDVRIFRALQEHREQNGWAEPNDISVLKIGSKTHVTGTAAHFAVMNYQPTRLLQIHPGYVHGDTLDSLSTSDYLLSRHATQGLTTAKMLVYLLYAHKVDLFKPNHDQKTPLDCLPPDADPLLVHSLLGFGQGDPRHRGNCSQFSG